MPEIKNTFLKSKMNKDLDARLIPNGEYRDGQNISVSASEGSDVGALENIRGNFNLTNFGLTDENLEVIGTVVDEAKNRIYFFITNFSDGSSDSLSFNTSKSFVSGQFTINGAKNCIAYCEIPYLQDDQLNSNTITSSILVEGAFLNFSKTHPVLSNILEDFLFFTDDRNQPRKINVEKAIANPLTYYTHEDHISVAKFAPYKPISFLNDTVTPSVSTLKNEKDYWLPAVFIAPANVYQASNPTRSRLIFDNEAVYGTPINAITNGKYASPASHFGTTPNFNIRIYKVGDENKSFAYLNSFSITTNINPNDRVETSLYKNFNTATGVPSGDVTNIEEELGWTSGVFAFEIKNPDYNSSFRGDVDLLREKFVKFSYRFKYDDGEYSLMAPFSQAAFIPKQYGYFIGDDDEKAKESSIVNFMENQVTTVGLVVDLPYNIPLIKESLKVEEIQIIYKSSDDLNLKVIADVKSDTPTGSPSVLSIIASGDGFTPSTTTSRSPSGGSGSGLVVSLISDSNGGIVSSTITNPGTGYRVGDIVTSPSPDAANGGRPVQIQISQLNNKFIYNYASQKPIKVLDEQEVIRVNDIIPIRAKTQEIVGNRIVYGNFLQNKSTPNSLNYDILTSEKTGDNKKEFLNHTLKQGRTYQVGIVLQDRYGRASNVIVNNNAASSSLNSTFFAPYTDGGSDPLNWPGNCLKVSFLEKIQTQPTSNYMGVWDEINNPLGWYTYKVVIKQQDQDYYNIYSPGGISGNINFEKLTIPLSYSETGKVFQIPLINDNINKIPRDLKQVGPNDRSFGSSTILFARVSNTIRGADNTTSTPGITVGKNINSQNFNTKDSEVVSIKEFADFGEWTRMKNINVRFVDSSTTVSTTDTISVTGPYVPNGSSSPSDLVGNDAFYIYPGSAGNVDPFFLKNNKNPLIATISTNKRLGYSYTNQDNAHFAKELVVLETKPFKSNIDIYYESSNTGLITDFNNSIGLPTGNNGEPVDISNFTASLSENVNSNIDVSNVFQAVDSNGNNVLGNNPNIEMTVNRINSLTGNSVPVNNKFNLVLVQQPALNIPPTYKITTNAPFVYDQTSYIEDNYEFVFTITSNLSNNSNVVTRNIPLTNVKPSIYSISCYQRGQSELDQGASGNNYYLNIENQLTLDSFLNSSKNSPLTQTLIPDPSVSDFGSTISAIQFQESGSYGISSSGGQMGYPALLTHFSNGSQQLSAPFDDTNKFPTGSLRYNGVVYEVQEAKAYACAWRNNDRKYYYDDFSHRNWNYRGADLKNFFSFSIRGSGFVSNYNYDTPSIMLIPNRSGPVIGSIFDGSPNFPGFPFFAGLLNNYKQAILMYLKVSITDANNQLGKRTSSTYNMHFLYTK